MTYIIAILLFLKDGLGFRTSQSLTPALILSALLLTQTASAGTGGSSPQWNPQSSEKLVKLPATYLKKSIESDFADSELGSAIEAAEENSNLKIYSLRDLKEAVEQADGPVKTELRHQFLAEKKAYLDLMSEKNRFRHKQLLTKKRLYEGMLEQLEARNGFKSASQEDLIHKQEMAHTRFSSSLETVELRLFEASVAPQSKYAKKYSANMAAIEKLIARVKNHKMNASAQSNGKSLSKEEYIRQLLSENEGEIAILNQEETILGYMAKLVALDALRLSEEALDVKLADSNIEMTSGPAEAHSLFLSN